MEFIEIGVVLKPQGIKGELKVRPLTGDVSVFLKQKTIYMLENGVHEPYALQSARTDKDAAYVRLFGVSDRNEAEALRNRPLYVKKEDIPLPEGTHYIADLIGMEVYGGSGEKLGNIRDVIVTGASDVYVVESECGGFMFPALKRVIRQTDVKAKKMTLDEKALSEVAVYEV